MQRPGRLPVAPLGKEPKELRHEIVSSLEERNRSVRTLRGLASVRLGGKVFGRRREAAIVLKRPGSLRLEGLGEFGSGGVEWVVSGGEILVIWGDENRYLKGLASRDEMERMLAVSLDPEETVLLLAGAVPVEEEGKYLLKKRPKGTFLLRGEEGKVIVEKKGPRYLPVQFTAFDIDGSRDYTVDLSDYAETEGIWFPRRFKARFFDPRSQVEIHFHEVDLNRPIDEKLFRLKIPDDATPADY